MESFKREVTLENIADTYNGRPWEEVSTDELERISSMRVRIGRVSERLSMKAKEILEERRAAEEKDRKALDDGSVRGLILSGDYRNVGHTVMVQKMVNGKRAWDYASVNDDELETYIEGEETTGYMDWLKIDENASEIVTACRRKFKKQDMILCALLDENSESMTGIVFLQDKLYSFDAGKPEYGITYAEIEDADFTEDSVTIKVSDGGEASLYCHDGDNYRSEREYAKSMYNLIMDIRDRAAEA
ncbi:MAG: hypothetical protein NC489_28845 [Ruminococcus flavefaciens]|nr:hypothetical protein [Ruminococcus flavefaciens]